MKNFWKKVIKWGSIILFPLLILKFIFSRLKTKQIGSGPDEVPNRPDPEAMNEAKAVEKLTAKELERIASERDVETRLKDLAKAKQRIADSDPVKQSDKRPVVDDQPKVKPVDPKMKAAESRLKNLSATKQRIHEQAEAQAKEDLRKNQNNVKKIRNLTKMILIILVMSGCSKPAPQIPKIDHYVPPPPAACSMAAYRFEDVPIASAIDFDGNEAGPGMLVDECTYAQENVQNLATLKRLEESLKFEQKSREAELKYYSKAVQRNFWERNALTIGIIIGVATSTAVYVVAEQ